MRRQDHAYRLDETEYAALGESQEFAVAVFDGLSKRQKTLPCRFFYDAIGSSLFERITVQPEYYPTRTEAAILQQYAAEMMAGVPSDSVLIEFGSGSSTKTEIILRHAPKGLVYVPIDVSETALMDAVLRLGARFPGLDVMPLVGNFSMPIELPPTIVNRPRIGFFPGSTIGNLEPHAAEELLRTFRRLLTAGSRLLIGADLKKDPATLVKAYDDAAGVTAAFNLNILARINQELGGSVDLSTFRHEARYDPRKGRIEMHLVSSVSQTLPILDRSFQFASGESIHTENSYKYTIEDFHQIARGGNWRPGRVWTDSKRWFSVHELIAADVDV